MNVRIVRSGDIARIAKTTGHDFIFIDMQHSLYSVETIGHIAQVALAIGVTPMVRVRSVDDPDTSVLLDNGVTGIVFPDVNNADEARRLLRDNPDLWLPDNLLLLQEYFPVDPAKGIVRMEFLGGQLLYAMRVVSHGAFNLCPSEVCNPIDGEGHCEIPAAKPVKPVEFYAYPEVPAQAVAYGKQIVDAGQLDVGGIEYLEAADGRLIFYDVNANSNLRAPIAQEYGGFDPFERVADFLSTPRFPLVP